MATLPQFQKDVSGEYAGNAYPEQTEYRITIEQMGDGTEFVLATESTDGTVLGTYRFDEDIADGICDMANTNHDLSGYEDDWALPTGMYRALHWLVPNCPIDVTVILDEDAIDEIRHWLQFALGHDTYDGPEDRWEF
jgi:hypothetical protein